MSDMKKYVLTALTLGLIAASGALLIAGANMITRERIAQNEKESVNKGIAKIFNDGQIGQDFEVDDEIKGYYPDVKYSKHVYEIVKSNGGDNPSTYLEGLAIQTTGSNNYGKVSLIIGFTKDCVYKGLSVISNEQSFASTLKKGYLDEIKDGDKTIDDVSVSCGATYGAKLVRAMVEEAKELTRILTMTDKGANNG